MDGEPTFTAETTMALSAVESAATVLNTMIEQESTIEITVKLDNTLLLNVDLALQAAILNVLTPSGTAIVSEELPQTHQYIGGKKNYFIVDPLDGTTSCKRFFGKKDTQVGYGPMVGVVSDQGTLHAVVFFNCPAQKIFIAEKGKGVWYKDIRQEASSIENESEWKRLSPHIPSLLSECGMLFYAGMKGELQAVEKIKKSDLVENMYRFGGFANDCSRIAQGFEQVQLQYTVKAWDIPAALLIAEIETYDVFIKTSDRWIPIYDRVLEMENPMVACPKKFSAELLASLAS